MAALLKITNGTKTVNLLDRYGFHLFDWRPASPQWKNDGSWSDIASADGRRLKSRVRESITDELELKMRATSQSVAARKTQELRSLLEDAANYWLFPGNKRPVYIMRRASKETAISYAIISKGFLVDDQNPFSSPFLQPSCNTVQDELSLILEHDMWSDIPPDTDSPVPAGVILITPQLAPAAPIYLGNTELTMNSSDPVYGDLVPVSEAVVVSNADYFGQIYSVIRERAGVFTDISYTADANLFGPVSLANDTLYIGFGVNPSAYQHPIQAIDFMNTTSSGSMTLDIERWNGVGWVNAPYTDGTGGTLSEGVLTFDWSSGVGSFLYPAVSLSTIFGAAPFTYNLHWVRIIDTVGGSTVQLDGTRYLSAPNKPYVTVPATGGVYPALGMMKIESLTGERDWMTPDATQIHQLHVCAIPDRLFNTTPRYDPTIFPLEGTYTPYIALADLIGAVQFAGYDQAEPEAQGTSFFEEDFGSPFGQGIRCEVDSADVVADRYRLSVLLNPQAYQGRYRLYMRYHTSGSGNEVVTSYAEIYTVEGVSLRTATISLDTSATENFVLADYGVVTVPPYWDEKMHYFDPRQTKIMIFMQNTGSGVQTIKAIDLILWPADNRMAFTATLRSPTYTGEGLRNGYYVQADSIYRRRTSTYLRFAGDLQGAVDPVVGSWITDSATAFLFPHDETFRVYFFGVDMQEYPNRLHSYPKQTFGVTLSGSRRYATVVGS